MKYRIIYFLIILWSITGCEDLLDVNPKNSLTFKNALETEKDLTAALDGVGRYVRNMANLNYRDQIDKGCYADVVLEDLPSRRLSPEMIDWGYWEQYYSIIAQANIVLHFAAQIEMKDDRKAIYTGQASFYKALAYFDLIRKFGDCMLIKDEVELEPKAKTPWTEVADYAIGLAREAAASLPEFYQMTDYSGKAPRYKSTPCRGAAYALLAHLCAWKAGGKYFAADRDYDEEALWREAKEACDNIILSGTYVLAGTPEEVCSVVLSGDSQESIYETVYKNLLHELGDEMNQTNMMCLGRFYQSFPVMPNSVPSDIKSTYFNVYSSKMKEMFPGEDQRLQAYFYKFDTYADPDSVSVTGGYAFPYKWREAYVSTEQGSAGRFINFNVNRVWWRLADIYLLRAECKARLGDVTAVDDLNAVRDRARAKRYESSEYDGDLRYAIYKERERELLFEGQRYYDIIRNGYVRRELDGGYKTASDQDFIDGALFLTLDERAFVRNPLMRQNKYWLKFM